MRELGFDYGMYLVWAITIILAVVGSKFYFEGRRSKKGK